MVVLLDLVIWIPVFLRERKIWDAQLAIVEGNVSVIVVNVAIYVIVVLFK